MDAQILKIVGQVAGIGGIAIGTFLLLFREVIRKNIFSKLLKTHSYQLMRLLLILVWSVALAGIIAYVYVANPHKQTVLLYRGSVRDAVTKLPISGAVVSILGRPDITSQATDNKGDFSFTLETATGDFQGKVQATHSGYEVWTKELSLTASTTEEVLLSKEKPQEFELSGAVRDEKGALEGARISAKDVTTYSSKDGAFILKVKGQRGERFELKADKQGYQHWQEDGVEVRSGISIIMQRK